MERVIEIENLTYRYARAEETSLKNITLAVEKGKFMVIMGHAGAGKTSLSLCLNGLIPQFMQGRMQGKVRVKGKDTRSIPVQELAKEVGLVLQDPESQIICRTVGEDVAFGPENLGVPPLEIRKRVDEALSMVGISDYAKHAPHLLSGGQKQRVAIAGILAMKPDCIVLDEATSMLDPIGRKEVMAVLKKLNTREGITIIHITHHMDEASLADRVLVMDHGKIVLSGTPKYVFSNVEVIKNLGLEVPQVTELFYVLRKEGIELPNGVLDVDEAVNLVKDYLEKST